MITPLPLYCFHYLGAVEEAYYCGRVLEAIEASK
jgi:hypothetical protein